ncbi:MAG: hypothetical protein ACM3SQ_19475 [Betaproteobacteria bacterium]
MKKSPWTLLLPLVVLASACQAQKSSNPLSPTVAGPIPGVSISPPAPVQPQVGSAVAADQQPVTLVVANATTSGVRPLSYRFEVATDAGFAAKVFQQENIKPGNGRTSLRLPSPLPTDHTYYWRARAQDGANTGPYFGTASFQVYTPVVIHAPVPTSPINNVVVTSLGPTFTFGNAPRTGPAGAITYTIEVSTSSSFSGRVIWTVREQGGSTTLHSPQNFSYSGQYYWHVRGSDTSGHTGPWSVTEAFRTPAAPVVAPPSGGGGGGGSLPPGTACSGATELDIVKCRRSQYGAHMTASEIVAMLKGIASDLNRHPFPYARYGILEKPGSACLNYSCDIICSGAGSTQKQWDVLANSDPVTGTQSPLWNGPLGTIAVRVCDPQ